MAVEVSTWPLFLFERKEAIHLCCRDGIYKLDEHDVTGASNAKSEPFDEFGMLSDDEDLFNDDFEPDEPPEKKAKPDASAATIPSSQSSSAMNFSNATKVYKYKHEAIGFSLCDNVLYSLHRKSNSATGASSLHVECTRPEDLTCANGCLAKFDPEMKATSRGKASASGSPWIRAIKSTNLTAEHDRSGGGGGNGVTLFIGDGQATATTRVIEVLEGRVVNESRSKYVADEKDVFLKFYRGSKPEHGAKDIVDRILSEQKVIPPLDGGRCFPKTCIDQVHPIGDGFLVVTKSNRIWQFSKEGAEVEKIPLPLRGVRLLSLSEAGDRACALTDTGGVYRFSLPFRARGDDCKTLKNEGNAVKERLSRSEVVSEILESASALKNVDVMRSAQRRTVEQLKIARQLKDSETRNKSLGCSCSVSRLCSLAQRPAFQLQLAVVNRTNHTLSGDFWVLAVTVTGKKASRSLTWTVNLPVDFAPNKECTGLVDLPEEFASNESLPLVVSGDLRFSYSGRKGHVVWKAEVMRAECTLLDFLQVAGASESRPVVSEDRNSFSSHVNRLRDTREGRTTTSEEEWRRSNGFPFVLRQELLDFHKDLKPSIAQLKACMDEMSEGGGERHFLLRGKGVEIEASATRLSEGSYRLFFVSPEKDTLLALKESLLALSREYTIAADVGVKVSKRLITESDVIREEVAMLSERKEASGENVALLEKLLSRFRTSISKELV